MGTALVRSFAEFQKQAPLLTAIEGKTLDELLDEMNAPGYLRKQLHVTLNGREFDRDLWGLVRLREHDMVNVYVVPLGGDTDSKDILRMVALVVIAVVATVYVTPAATAAWGEVGGALAGAAFTMAGSLLVNALIPPVTPDAAAAAQGDPSYFLRGTTSRIRPGELIPCVYGRVKMVLDLAAVPDIYNVGKSSVYTALYTTGLGDHWISDIRIGENSIDNMEVTTRILRREPRYDMQGNIKPVDLQMLQYPNHYQDLSLRLELIHDEHILTTAEHTSSAVVEFFAPQGQGKYPANSVDIEWHGISMHFEYRPVGATEWMDVPEESLAIGSDHMRWNGTSATTPPNDNPSWPDDGWTPPPTDPAPPPNDDQQPSGDQFRTLTTPVAGTLESWLTFSQDAAGVTDQIDLEIYVDSTVDPASVAQALVFIDADTRQAIPTDLIRTDDPAQWDVIDAGHHFRAHIDTTEQGSPTSHLDGVRVLALLDHSRVTNGNGWPFESGRGWSQQVYIDTGQATTPTLPAPPQSRYSETAGAETWVRLRQKRVAPTPGHQTQWVNDYSGIEVRVGGHVQPQGMAGAREQLGELIKTEPLGEVGDAEYREAWFALRDPARNITSRWYDWIDDGNDPNWVSNKGAHHALFGNETVPGYALVYIPFPARGQYEIRVTRTSKKDQGEEYRVIDNLNISRLNSRGTSTATNPHAILNPRHALSYLEMQVKADEGVAGSLDEITAIVGQRLRWHDGTQWQNAEVSSNPSDIILDLLTGWRIQNHYAEIPRDWTFDGGWITDDQIDFPSFKRFRDHCAEQVQWTQADGQVRNRDRYSFNGIISSDAPIIETVQQILAMCRSRLIVTEQGQLAIMIDEAQTTPRQLFTPQNVQDFKGERQFIDMPDVINVSFLAPELDWQQATLQVVRPGKTLADAKIFEELPTVGCTSWHMAYQYALYQMAQGVYRNESASFVVDAEHLAVRVGDLVHVQHDVPLLGGQACYITQVNGPDLLVDQELKQFPAPLGYTVRTTTGSIRTGNLVRATAGGNAITLDVSRNVNPGDLIVIGTGKPYTGQVTEKYLVSGIVPQVNMKATVKLVRYAEEMYRTDLGDFPSWDPGFGNDGSWGTSLRVFNLRAFLTSHKVQGVRYVRVSLTWEIDGANIATYDGVQIRFSHTGFGNPAIVGTPYGQVYEYAYEYRLGDPAHGAGFITVVPRSVQGRLGHGDTVPVGEITDPEWPDGLQPPTEFFANVRGQEIDANWHLSISPGVTRYELRFSPDPQENQWANTTLLATTNSTTSNVTVPARTGTYMLRCYNRHNEKSPVVYQRTTVDELPDINVVERVEDAPTWPGSKVRFRVENNKVLVTSNSYTPGNPSPVRFSQLASTFRSYYRYHEILDLGDIYECRLVDMIATSFDDAGTQETRWDAWVEYRVGSNPVVMADWVPDLTSPLADPLAQGAQDWSDWQRFTVADVTGRYFEFRLVAEVWNPNTEIHIKSGLIEVDMPDRIWAISDVQVPVNGLQIDYAPAFRAVKAVAVTIDGNPQAQIARITSKTRLNMHVELVNAATGQSEPGQVDVMALGYGRVRGRMISPN